MCDSTITRFYCKIGLKKMAEIRIKLSVNIVKAKVHMSFTHAYTAWV